MKHRSGIVLAGLLLATGICTVVSAKNYAEDLAVVTLTSTAPNSIRIELTVKGELYYEDIMKMSLPAGCTVEEIFTQEGAWLNAGDPILRLKESDLQIAYYELCLEEEILENTLEEGGTLGELAKWKQIRLKEEMDSLEKLISDHGMIHAQKEVYVIRQGYETEKKTTGESMLELGVTENGYRLEWAVDMADQREFTSGNALIEGDKIKLSWENPVFRNGSYHYSMKFSSSEKYAQGYPAEIQLKFVSEEYKTVIPKSCVRYDGYGGAYVYEVVEQQRNFGKEYVVWKTGITIVDQDDVNVAVKAPLSNVVVRSSKELADMEAVAIIEK